MLEGYDKLPAVARDSQSRVICPEDHCYMPPSFGTTERRAAADPVDVGPARGKSDQPGRAGKKGGQERADGGDITVDAVGAPARLLARPPLPVAMAAAPKPPMVVPQ